MFVVSKSGTTSSGFIGVLGGLDSVPSSGSSSSDSSDSLSSESPYPSDSESLFSSITVNL